jgi:hypothetical protein
MWHQDLNNVGTVLVFLLLWHDYHAGMKITKNNLTFSLSSAVFLVFKQMEYETSLISGMEV